MTWRNPVVLWQDVRDYERAEKDPFGYVEYKKGPRCKAATQPVVLLNRAVRYQCARYADTATGNGLCRTHQAMLKNCGYASRLRQLAREALNKQEGGG